MLMFSCGLVGLRKRFRSLEGCGVMEGVLCDKVIGDCVGGGIVELKGVFGVLLMVRGKCWRWVGK